MYYEKHKVAGNYLMVELYGANIGFHKGHRAKRHSSTTDSVKRYNHKRRSYKMLEYILCNFVDGYFITLKYLDSNHPASYQDAENYISKFIASIRIAARQQGLMFKCIWVTERGNKENRLHHHIVIDNNKAIRELIYKKWNGGINREQIGKKWTYKELADYIVKYQGKEERKKNMPLFHTTRPLLKAKTTTNEIHYQAMPSEPVSPNGYEVLSNSFICGNIPLLGIPFQKYICRKIDNQKENHRKSPQRQSTAGITSPTVYPLRFPPSIKHISRGKPNMAVKKITLRNILRI